MSYTGDKFGKNKRLRRGKLSSRIKEGATDKVSRSTENRRIKTAQLLTVLGLLKSKRVAK